MAVEMAAAEDSKPNSKPNSKSDGANSHTLKQHACYLMPYNQGHPGMCTVILPYLVPFVTSQLRQ